MATELRFPVELDDGQASKELDNLVNKMNKLKESIAKNESARAPIVEQLKEAQDAAVEAYNRVEELKAALAESEAKTSITGNADPGTYIAEIQRQAQIKAELAEQEKIMQAKEKEAQRLEAQDSKILDVLAQQTAELEQAQERAGELTKQITDATKGKNLKAIFESTQAAVNNGVKSLLKYGIGIRTLFTLFSKLKDYTVDAVKAYAENDPETQAHINSLKASLAGLQATWGAAFAPVLNAVIPVLQTLISWINTAINAIASFFALLGGRGTFKRATSGMDKLAGAAGGAADAAKEAKKQLMGIDELNVLQDNDTGGGGGGGGGGTGLDYEDVEISDFLKDNFNTILDIVIAVGAALAGWKFANILKNLGLIKGGFKQILGIATIFAGTAGLIKGAIDGWKNGVDSTNLIEMLSGAALAALGAFLAFGQLGGAIALLIGGVAMLVVGIKDWIATGELSHETCALIVAGLGTIGIAISLLTGSWIPVAIAAVVALVMVIISYWGEISAWFDEHVGTPLKEAWNKLKEAGAEFAAATKQSFEDIKANAEDLKNKFVEKFDNIRDKVKSAWETIKTTLAQKLSFPHIPLPHFSISGQFSLKPPSVPHFSVDWYAKGGIVDGATLIGAGEAGKEAIIPLERNTEWIRSVAQEITSLLFDEDIFSRIADKISLVPTALDRMTAQLASMTMPALPAVATGLVVPPNAAVTYTGITPELAEKLSNFLDRFGKDSGSSPIEVYPVVELDGVRVSKQLHSYTKRETRMHGKSLIEVD